MEEQKISATETIQTTEQLQPLTLRNTEHGSIVYAGGTKIFFYLVTVFSGISSVCSWGASEYFNAIGQVGRSSIAVILMTISIIFLGIGFSLSSLVTGYRRHEKKLHFYFIDKIPMEISILLAFAIFVIGMNIITNNIESYSYYAEGVSGYQEATFYLYKMGSFIGILSLLGMILFLMLLLSIVRQFKGGRRNWLCIKFSKQIFHVIYLLLRKMKVLAGEVGDVNRFQDYSFQKKMFLRQFIYVISIFAMLVLNIFVTLLSSPYSSFRFAFLLISLVVFAVLTAWYVKENNRLTEDIGKITEQIEEIHRGNLGYFPPIAPTSLLYEPSQKLSGISNGFQKSVEERVKSERMKIELVTNVSHDLKTPLTSIISYVNLLSMDDTLSAEARDYVNILAQKSDRLKNIVSDLFDLAKVSSGSSEMNYEMMDMSKLVIQTLADMEDRIELSGQIVKTNIAEPPIPIYADGKKMYRVLQNVFDNALKYALKGTRIFIDLFVKDGWSHLSVKNTAGYEMNFTEEEILERFARGDKARTTEGSGLGLSIAKGFAHACGGDFQIHIDGDQFKVTVSLPMHQQQNQQEPEPSQPQPPAAAPAAHPESVPIAFDPMNIPPFDPSQPRGGVFSPPPQKKNGSWNYL